MAAIMLNIPAANAAERLIHISVDGLYADAIRILGPNRLPNFYRLSQEGVSTLAARTDFDYTDTLPNHASQLTGRPVKTAAGHEWIINFDPGTPVTLHTLAKEYVASVFDRVHDAGKSTTLFASKDKFAVFDRSWNAIHGAADNDGIDNGPDKIDRYVFMRETGQLVSAFIADLQLSPRHYAFLHIRDPDSAGHSSAWDWTLGSDYMNSIIGVDVYLGQLLSLLDSDSNYRNKTVIILTSDHGGQEKATQHKPVSAESHVVPFYVWGAGVAANVSLYDLNRCTAQEPAAGDNPPHSATLQPIRNGDAANLAVGLLNLPAVSGSTIKTLRHIAPTTANHQCVSSSIFIPYLLLL